MQITVTTAQIIALAANREAFENQFTWNSGEDSFTLQELAEGMERDSFTTLTADGLTEDAKLDFVEGFTDAAPAEYNHEADCESPAPICAPWTWAILEDWFRPLLTPFQMGEAWASECRELFE